MPDPAFWDSSANDVPAEPSEMPIPFDPFPLTVTGLTVTTGQILAHRTYRATDAHDAWFPFLVTVLFVTRTGRYWRQRRHLPVCVHRARVHRDGAARGADDAVLEAPVTNVRDVASPRA